MPTDNEYHSLEEALSSVLDDSSLLFPGTKEYEQSNTSYFAASANEIRPSFIIHPPDVDTVSKVLKALRSHLLRGTCQLAIRGAGHTPFATSTNIQDGVTVDLRGLKGIVLNEDRSAVTIGMGETWASVYTELEKHDLTTAGGRQGCVGVSGLILGGGLSLYSGRYGFGCDSVLDFEVVLASGEIVHANAEQHSDLWIALKGGLNNFGIVTKFTMKTFDAGPVWGGHYHYSPDPDLVAQLCLEICDFFREDPDRDIHCLWGVDSGSGFPVALSMMYHTKGQVHPPALQRFTELEKHVVWKKDWSSISTKLSKAMFRWFQKLVFWKINSLRTSTRIDFCKELFKSTVMGRRQFYAAWTFRPNLALMVEYNEMFQKTLDSIKNASGLLFMLVFQPLTKATLQSSEPAGGNAKCISPDDGPLLIASLNPAWKSAQDDDRIYAVVKTLLADCRRLAHERGLLHRYIFTNYGFQEDDVMKGHGEQGVQLMRAASTKYDPDGIFQNAVPGGFKLPKA